MEKDENESQETVKRAPGRPRRERTPEELVEEALGPRPPGRPRHEPTPVSRAHVERACACGIPELLIARIVGITAPTLRLHYREELDTGLHKANLAVANNLFRQATKDDPKAIRAIEFWLACRAGWTRFASAPVDKVEPLGKKQIAEREAETAAEGTEWSDLVH